MIDLHDIAQQVIESNPDNELVVDQLQKRVADLGFCGQPLSSLLVTLEHYTHWQMHGRSGVYTCTGKLKTLHVAPLGVIAVIMFTLHCPNTVETGTTYSIAHPSYTCAWLDDGIVHPDPFPTGQTINNLITASCIVVPGLDYTLDQRVIELNQKHSDAEFGNIGYIGKC